MPPPLRLATDAGKVVGDLDIVGHDDVGGEPAGGVTVAAVPWLCVLWPAFLMAGVLETLVFAVLDPQQMQWFGAVPVGWSAITVYSVAFLVFWMVIALASAITQYLVHPEWE